MIIATAGHVDHGKTSLVHALTGVDTDRLPEERRRGMTIDLGFAYADLPGGERLAFVDVPGHERFVKNMLAGVSAVDFALLVVAADDGPMPQSREHLAILDLLGVARGAVALTKVDRVDAARRAEAAEEAELLVAGTCLEAAPVLPVSAITGEGIEGLRAHLAAAAAATARRAADGRFRLAVDRSFVVAGAGLVVTGTVFAGRVAVGDRVTVAPGGLEARVRGIHAQNREAGEGLAGDRCALNLAGPGLERGAVQRGDWTVAPPAALAAVRIDARLRLLADEPRPLQHWTPVHLHLGAADVTARVAVLEGTEVAPGGSALVQIVPDRPVGAWWGDPFILRDQSATRTIGGGRVIDPAGPARGRNRAPRLAALAAMAAAEPAAALAGLLAATDEGVDLAGFARGRNLADDAAAAAFAAAGVAVAGGRGFAADRWGAAADAAEAALAAWHEAEPHSLGPDERVLRQQVAPRMPADAFAELVGGLVRAGRVARRGVVLALPGHRPQPSPEEARLWSAIEPLIEGGGLRPPIVREIAAATAMEPAEVERFLGRATQLGLVVRVSRNRFFPPPALLELGRIAERLAGEAADGRFDAARFRDASGIGRNLTIELLEFFDRAGLTRREAEGRSLKRTAEDCFGAG